MELKKLTETQHKELMVLINPLIDFMSKNGYSFFLVAGKDGVCTRHLMGKYDDIHGMISGMMQTQKQVETLITDVVNDFEKGKI
jgi:hypothetical protein